MTSKVDVHTKILYPPDEKKPTMTKAEAEVIWRKNELLALCSKTDLAFNERLKKRFDLLISAAHAEGVAEGAEQERERIRGESQMVGVDSESVNFIGIDNYIGSAFLVPVDVMDPPTSTLAPTRESS